MDRIKGTLPFSSKKHSGLLAAAQYAQEQKLEVITNNLAMAELPGAKSGSVKFKEFIFRTPEGEKISFVRVDKVIYDFDQGGFKTTGVKSHVGLNGKGFMKVRTSRGTMYTRNGEFIVSPDGLLTTALGDPVLSEDDNTIDIGGSKNFHIDSSGNISTEDGEPIKLAVVNFEDYKSLRLQGKSLYISQEPEIPFEGVIQQGVLERSNVSSMNEVVQLTFAHRHFEAAQKMLDEYEKNSKRTMNTSARNV